MTKLKCTDEWRLMRLAVGETYIAHALEYQIELKVISFAGDLRSSIVDTTHPIDAHVLCTSDNKYKPVEAIAICAESKDESLVGVIRPYHSKSGLTFDVCPISANGNFFTFATNMEFYNIFSKPMKLQLELPGTEKPKTEKERMMDFFSRTNH